jgi:hypothetical protein
LLEIFCHEQTKLVGAKVKQKPHSTRICEKTAMLRKNQVWSGTRPVHETFNTQGCGIVQSVNASMRRQKVHANNVTGLWRGHFSSSDLMAPTPPAGTAGSGNEAGRRGVGGTPSLLSLLSTSSSPLVVVVPEEEVWVGGLRVGRLLGTLPPGVTFVLGRGTSGLGWDLAFALGEGSSAAGSFFSTF